MLRWVGVCVVKPDNLSSAPELHTVKGENDSHKCSSDLATATMAHAQ